MMRYALLFFATCLSTFSPAQNTAGLSTQSKKAIEMYVEADNHRVRREFDEAIALLNKAIDKDRKFVEAYLRLGQTYFTMKQYSNAVQQYEKGLSLAADLNRQKQFWFAMGESYFLSKQYEKAMNVLDLYLKNEKTNRKQIDQAKLLYNSAVFALQSKNDVNALRTHPLSDTVNAFELQYFPVLTADQSELIFTRRLGDGPNDDEDLVISRKNSNGQWLAPESISRNINTKDNREGTCSISADGRKLILTVCPLNGCDLYESIKIGNDWSEPRNLGPNVNSRAWDSQPSLSSDGRTLYFISNRGGGLGQRDIWVSVMNDMGQWTKAVNLGSNINSQFDEYSPFIHANNKTLFFSTNGRPGFGGYDIFYSNRDSSGWTTPKNLGAPINDPLEQFSLFITADSRKGYYSREETLPDGHSRSKIYEVLIPLQNQVEYRSNYVKGIIRDKVSKSPLGAKIELLSIKTDEVISLVSSDSVTGEYLMVLTQGDEYALYVTKAGYLFKSYNFNYSEITDFQPITIDMDLEKVMAGSVAVLNNIFFDVDKYELKEKSSPELQKILRFLKENPRVRVEIGGHTDNSGSASHNRELSEKRARSVYGFLVQHGVDKARLEPKGYGPDRPISPNDTEEGRQQNRRIEFRILH
jgi:OOP family OmpA-OmpF porin